MPNYRIFLLSFLIVSWVFLTGLNEPVEPVYNDKSTEESHKTEAELQSIETEKNTRKLLKTKQIKAENSSKSVEAISQKAKQTATKEADADVADDNKPIQRNEFEKPLDLSVPFKNPENADLKIEQKSAAQSGVTNIFAPETKKKPRQLEVDGNFLMSPEPEAGKQKSVDGAGLIIKLKP
jgi:hypothetical protein